MGDQRLLTQHVGQIRPGWAASCLELETSTSIFDHRRPLGIRSWRWPRESTHDPCLVAGEPGCFLSIQMAAEFGFGQRIISGPWKLPAGTSMKKPKQSGPGPLSSNRAKFG